MRIFLSLSALLLLCASVATGAGTLTATDTLIESANTGVHRAAVSEPVGLVALGAGFVLLAHQVRRKKVLKRAFAFFGLLGVALSTVSDPRAQSCANAIACENLLPGNPQSEWDISGAGDPTIQGFATDISVNRGETVHFKINTTRHAYRLDIYRLGYYGGHGARKVATIRRRSPLPQAQPACLTDARDRAGRLRQLGGVGLVGRAGRRRLRHLHRQGSRASEPAARATSSSSSATTTAIRLLFQTSDTTWQAYNDYGGNSLYVGGPGTSPAAPTKSATTARSPRAAPRPRTACSTPSTRWSAGSKPTATTSAT